MYEDVKIIDVILASSSRFSDDFLFLRGAGLYGLYIQREPRRFRRVGRRALLVLSGICRSARYTGGCAMYFAKSHREVSEWVRRLVGEYFDICIALGMGDR